MRYKQYLNEITKKELDDDSFINWIKKNGKKYAKNCVKNDSFLYRGINGEGLILLDKPWIRRQSANTWNYYTVIMNEHSSWNKFPKRATICSSSYDRVQWFGKNQYVMFLKDNVKIGICPGMDLWYESFINLSNDEHDCVDDFNALITDVFREVGAQTNIDSLTQLKQSCDKVDEMVKKDDKILYNGLNSRLIYSEPKIPYVNTMKFFNYLLICFQPKNFIVENSSKININKYNNKECWFDTECVMINYNYFMKYKDLFKDIINEI